MTQPLTRSSRTRSRTWHRTWSRLAATLAGLLLTLALLWALGPRNPYGVDEPAPRAAPPAQLAQLPQWLAQQEAAVPQLRTGVAKGVVWHGAVGQRTPWAVVYVHGFTASRQEVAPLPERVATALQANVFYTRLTGHGSTSQAMGQATVQDWLADTVEAVRIGHQLGDKVLFIGTSTGGTLGTWLALRPEGKSVAAYVFISPNFGPKNPMSELINGPWGQQLALALEGPVRGEVSGRPQEAQAWTERYATTALFPMMALVQHVRDSDLSAFRAPVLVFYSEADETVEPEKTKAAFARMGSAHKTLERVVDSHAQGQHVLAGDLRDPQATDPMAVRTLAWLQGLGFSVPGRL